MLQTMKEMLIWLEKHYGSKEAVVDYPKGGRWSYTDLGDYSRRICANYTTDAGVKKGDRVGWLSLTASTDILALSFGARKIGAIPVIMNSRASIELIAWMINNAGLKTLAYNNECVDTVKKVREIGIPTVRQYIALEERRGNFQDEVTIGEIYKQYQKADEPRVDITEDDDCFICYTSGTTSRPKPILHKEGEWAWTMIMFAYQFSLHFDDVFMTSSSPSFAGWTHMTCGALRAAAKLVCSRFKPITYLKGITDEKGTHGQLTPTLVRMLYTEYKKNPDEFKLDSFRVSMVSGEPVTEDVVKIVREMFPNMQRLSSVGATEGISLFTAVPSAYLNEHWGTVGKPLPAMTVELRNPETGELVTESETAGEMYVKGPGVAAGVWNDPELTAKNFPDGWWKSGDLLYRDKAGYYYITGRSDHMFKSGGIKIFSEEVEGNLKRHPFVLDVVVVPIPHETFGFVPYAHIRNTEPLTVEIIETWWKEQGFAGYNRPRKWRFWGQEEFPMLGFQKVDRKKLKEEALKE